eukprot:4225452-Amphidinium_carterae.1
MSSEGAASAPLRIPPPPPPPGSQPKPKSTMSRGSARVVRFVDERDASYADKISRSVSRLLLLLSGRD